MTPLATAQLPGGIPFPRRGAKKATSRSKQPPEQLLDVRGVLRRLDETFVVVEAQDTRQLSMKRVEGTRFFKDGNEIQPAILKPGDRVVVEASQDDEGFLFAINVIFLKEGTAEERVAAAQPVAVPKRASAADDDDERPVLRRNGSRAAPTPETASTTREAIAATPAPSVEIAAPPAVEAGAPPPPDDPAIAKARALASSFTESLPNYICKQLMARFLSTSHILSWKPQDVVSADVVFENGRESYRNLTINGKPFKKSMEEMRGAWSTGEFGSMLADLFSRGTAAEFRFRRESRTAGRNAVVYDFDVDRDHSHWRISVASQAVYPAYRGSLWIEKETGRALRVEMQAYRLPLEFPHDKVESAVDYEYTRIGDRPFLLPVHAETLMCQRGTNICSRNTIDFRNYQKFSGEATITFEK